jgi:hypothetical protein
MTTEEIIACPKSGGDLCYKVQINPEISSFMSLSCGFWTNSLMKEGEEFYEQQMETLPELYRELAWVDPETNLTWIPNTINQPEMGMIFAYGPNAQNWGWAAVKAIEIPEEEQKEINGKKQTHKMDMANMQIFHERDYLEALSYLNILPK